MTPRLARWALALTLALFGSHALAAPATSPSLAMPFQVARTISYSAWTIERSTVRLRFTSPVAARRTLAKPGAAPLDDTAVGAAVLAGLAVTSRGGDCEAIDQGDGVGQVYTLAMEPGFDRYEIVFECPDAEGIVLHDHLLFEQAHEHVDYAQIAVDGARPRLAAFSFLHQELPAKAAPALADPAVQATVVRGALRIFQDPLRLCVLAALVLAVGRWPDPLIIGASAIGGYLVAIAVVAAGLEAPDVRLDRGVEGLITTMLAAGALLSRGGDALSARSWKRPLLAVPALVGAAVLALAAPKGAMTMVAIAGVAIAMAAQMALAGSAGWRRWTPVAPVMFLTALDGVTQAAQLSPLRPSFALAAPLLLQITLGAAAAVALTLALTVAVRWMLRNRMVHWRTSAREISAACLAGAGLFWFASQLYSF